MRRALIACALIACHGHDAPAPPAPAPVAKAPAAPIDARPPIDARDPALVAADAHALLVRWLGAQNGGDFDAYQALYDPRFQGVRRSGAQVARFDHDGWMRDRRRMFAHPMAVGAARENAVELRDHIFVTFTQTFDQGTYHDEGRKLIVLARRGGDLAIVHEEMLDSTLSAPAAPPRPRITGLAFGLGGAADAASMQLAIVNEGDLLLARTDDDLGDGPLENAIHHPSMGDDEHVSVERAIGATPPAALAAAVGLQLQLLDDHLAPVCTAKITSIDHLRAFGTDESEADVWAKETHVVVATIDAPGACRGRAVFARPAALPALPAPNRPATGEIASADGATVFTVGTEFVDDCNVHEVRKTTVARAGGWRGEVDAILDVVAAIDVDGDGAPDLITTTGVFRGSRRGDYDDWWPRMDFDLPAGVGCDGLDEP